MLLLERRWGPALYFTAPAIALTLWLGYLYQSTGHLLGNAEFTHYNVGFQLHPVRLGVTLFAACITSLLPTGTYRTDRDRDGVEATTIFRNRDWATVAAVGLVQTLVVAWCSEALHWNAIYCQSCRSSTLLLRPASGTIDERPRRIATAVLLHRISRAGFFINPIFPFPFENNAAFIDFVQLQRNAAAYVESHYPASTVTGAWPFPDALRRSRIWLRYTAYRRARHWIV